MCKFSNVSHSITWNCIGIDSQYPPCPVPMSLWLWQAPNYHPSTLDTLCAMLIGQTTFPSFLHPTFWQWHWCPHNMDIYNSQIHGSQFREYVISYCFVMSKSHILHMFSAYICTNESCFIHSNWLWYNSYFLYSFSLFTIPFCEDW